MKKIKLILFNFILSGGLIGQEISISLGKNNLNLNEYFTITITIKNGTITKHSQFPEIEGFIKKGIRSSSVTNIINGKVSQSFSIIQNYEPQKVGKFVLKPFSMEINDINVTSNGTSITVNPPNQNPSTWNDPFDDFFEGGLTNKTYDFIDIKEDAFFALEVDKKSIFVGEGVTVSISLYVSQQNKAEMEFVRLSEQIQEFAKRIKCKTCFEENMFINEITPEQIKIKNKEYTRYKLYETIFFPFNADPIGFPSLELELIKYKISKYRTFFGHEKQPDKLILYSKPVVVNVKKLPDHPLKDAVLVGDFKLEESISKKCINVGEGVYYRFSVSGTGNIASANPPSLINLNNSNLEIFEPNVIQRINKLNGIIHGRKTWNYYMVSNQVGTYHLKDFFQWIYFNSRLNKYDTLKSNLVLEVKGGNLSKLDNESVFHDEFYKLIKNSSNDIFKVDREFEHKTFINIILSLILSFSLGVIIFKTFSANARKY